MHRNGFVSVAVVGRILFEEMHAKKQKRMSDTYE
jgi:hypothetical protein